MPRLGRNSTTTLATNTTARRVFGPNPNRHALIVYAQDVADQNFSITFGPSPLGFNGGVTVRTGSGPFVFRHEDWG